MGEPLVMVVRHGEGRGRMPGYLDPVFARLARTSPTLHARLRFHSTGDPPPPLDDVRAVVFMLADPLRERYPECYEEATALAARARAFGIRVLNAPDALSNTIKSVQAERWRAAGIPTPEVRRFESREELDAHVRRLGFPLLIRADELHAQQGIRVCAGARDLADGADWELLLPGAVCPLVDVREGYRTIHSKGVYARFFHKKRLLVLGERIRTKHIFFSKQPVVTSTSCTFGRSHLATRMARFHPTLRACAREDLAFWERGTEHAELMRRAVAALDLDFAAIDYSSLADGSVILWEANPYPYLPDVGDILLESWRWAKERVASYYDAVGQFLSDAAGL